MPNLLEIEGLSVRFPGPRGIGALLRLRRPRPIEVLRGVSLSMASAETLALIGESGSGKTTLGRAVAGLVRPAAGRIALAAPEEGGARVAMMFQDPVGSLSPRRRVADLVLEPLRIRKVALADPAAEAARLLAMVGLPPSAARRYPHQLSGGQARRVTVAQALAVPPRLVICDEPTAGLDLSVQAEILNLMNDLQERLGIAYLLITHNLAVARRVSRRAAVMYLGAIVESGPSREMFSQPAHPYTARLLAAENGAAAAAGEEEPPSAAARPSGCAFHRACPIARPLCRDVPPAETEVAAGHRVRCHFPLPEGAI